MVSLRGFCLWQFQAGAISNFNLDGYKIIGWKVLLTQGCFHETGDLEGS
jgi:hypothetical protein